MRRRRRDPVPARFIRMAEGKFSLEAVLRQRESEQERLERDLARIARERADGRKIALDLETERERMIGLHAGSTQESGQISGVGDRIAFYSWLSHVGTRIDHQNQLAIGLDREFERVLAEWKLARTETEKIRILREKFLGERRVRERRMEEKALDFWALAKKRDRPDGSVP